MTSRREKDIEDSLTPLSTSQIPIQNELVDADIRVHVVERLAKDPRLKVWPIAVQKEIENTLTGGAKGMFRWVDCQLDCLRKCLKLDSLRRTLRSLPKTLDDTYQRIICGIDEEYREDALKVLQWLCFSVRPMHLLEMVEVLAVDLGDEPSFNPEQRLPDPTSILTICSTLITITPVTSSNDSDSDPDFDVEEPTWYPGATGVLSLAHYSVKEYLTSQRAAAATLGPFYITSDIANASITAACLTYLLHFEHHPEHSPKCPIYSPKHGSEYVLKYSLKDSPEYSLACSKSYFRQSFEWSSKIRKEYGLADYAARHWDEHYCRVSKGSHRVRITSLAYHLANSPGCYRGWSALAAPYTYRTSSFVQVPLIEFSATGLEEVAALLLDDGVDVHVRNDSGRTALHAASSTKQEAAARLLVSRGACVNAVDARSNTPLMAACSESDAPYTPDAVDSVARFLLENGAECNFQNNSGDTALHEAAGSRQSGVVSVLLDHSADINSRNRAHNTALHIACNRTRNMKKIEAEEVVRKLLDRGADYDAPGMGDMTPLATACQVGEESIMKLLLNKGASFTADKAFGRSPLHFAVVRGRESVLRLLLEHGHNLDVLDGYGETPLILACRESHEGVVRLLLEAGADLGAGKSCRTPMDCAVARGHDDMVRLLESYQSRSTSQPSPSSDG